jgi:DNA invertase Pin-like site-specific DNA recombinase
MIPNNVVSDIESIAAIYTRVSSTKTAQKDSPEHQRAICEELAEIEGLNVQYYYEDRSSGSSIMGRRDMQNLIKDAEKGLFRVVIFASLSRFSRDLADSLNMRRKLVEMLKVRLISIDEGYDSLKDKNSPFKFELFQMMNENYAKQISLSSRRGIKESARRGNFTGSFAPYGYKKAFNETKKTNSLEIVEKNAAVVRMIYNLYINHNMGEKKIINTLNENNIPSPKGEGPWGITTVQRILQNEAYTGQNVFGKYTVITKFDDPNNMEARRKALVQKDKNKWRRNEEKDWDPIIDDETFEKAQEIRLLRGGGSRGGTRNVKVNPFADIIKCKHCGSNYVSMKSGKNGKDGQEYRYLVCSSRRRMGVKGCSNGLWIPLHTFTEQLLNQITDQFSKFINIEEISQKVSMPKQNTGLNVQKEIDKMNNLIAKRRKNLFSLRKMFLDEEMDQEQYEFEKDEYEKEIKELQMKIAKIEKLQTKTNDEEALREQIKEALERLSKLKFNEVAELQFVLKQLIDKVDIDENGKVEIYTPIGKFA